MAKELMNAPETFQKRRDEILNKWAKQQASVAAGSGVSEEETRRECSELLDLLGKMIASGFKGDLHSSDAQPLVQFLHGISRNRAMKGLTPNETAGFIFGLKEVVLPMMQSFSKTEADFKKEILPLSNLLDQLALVTFEQYLSSREELIAQQQLDMTELSTPVVKIWDGILALPLIGTLDSKRTMVVMERLLQKIIDTASTVAILDITGVAVVDTLVASHIVKTVTATRLIGAECIITGISPAIAQTIVHLGVDLSGIITRASMAEGLKLAIKMTEQSIEEEREERKPPKSSRTHRERA